MRRLLLVPILAALALPAQAQAGGFATAGLSSTPDGVGAGEPWKVDITVLQHGRTPLDGLVPRVRISSGDTTRDFVAKPAGKAGVYRAKVVFPSAGRWDYVVLDGFIDEMPHTFPAVQIGDGTTAVAPGDGDGTAVAPADGDGGSGTGWLIGAGAALVLAAAVLGLDRRRRRPRLGAPEPA